METFKTYLRNFVEGEKATRPSDYDRGYIDFFLRAQEEAKTAEERKYLFDEQLIISVQDFFTGGSGTMSMTMAYAILYLIKHPDIQKKAQSELDGIVKGAFLCRYRNRLFGFELQLCYRWRQSPDTGRQGRDALPGSSLP